MASARTLGWVLLVGCHASFVDEEGVRVERLPAHAVIVDASSVGGACDDGRTPDVARSVKTPWCSLARALAATPAGWPVALRVGTYPLLEATAPSARSVELTVGAFPDEHVVLKGASLRDQNALAFEDLFFTDAVTVSSGNGALRFSRCDFTTSDGTPTLYVQEPVQGLRVEASRFHDVPRNDSPVSGRGIHGDPGGRDFFISRSTFERLGATGVRVQDTSRLTLEENSFQDTPEPVLVVDSSDVLIRANRFFGGQDPVGLRSLRGLVMENNLLTGFSLWAVAFSGVDSGAVRNNTVYGNGKGGLDFQDISVKGVSVQNNILQTLDGLSGGLDFEDYNLVTAGHRTGAHDLGGVPRFVDAASGDFHLAASSPGVDAALADHAPPADMGGHARVDDPAVVNTGAGTPPYGDWGALEGR